MLGTVRLVPLEAVQSKLTTMMWANLSKCVPNERITIEKPLTILCKSHEVTTPIPDYGDYHDLFLLYQCPVWIFMHALQSQLPYGFFSSTRVGVKSELFAELESESIKHEEHAREIGPRRFDQESGGSLRLS